MLRIVAISDTHGQHQGLHIPDGDVLIHAGDLTSHGSLSEVMAFNEFLGTLPHPHKIIIAGNHDFCFEQEPTQSQALLTNGTYLQDKAITIDGIKFYGSPWQPWFYNWAFNLARGTEIRAKWDLIPWDTDILITHGPPYGHGDRTTRREFVGCTDLLETVEKIRPQAHIFGHIHEGYGITSNEHTAFLNASTCTVNYEPINAALVFQFQEKN
ncbi:MAG: metallophosphatase domain-containing protein [Chloroflexota bacterium]